MEDKFELVPYDMSRVKRPEYIMMNGKPLNIYGAKKVLDEYQILIVKLQEEVKYLQSSKNALDAVVANLRGYSLFNEVTDKLNNLQCHGLSGHIIETIEIAMAAYEDYEPHTLVEQNKILKEALTITDAHFRMQNKVYSTEDTVGSVALQQCIDL